MANTPHGIAWCLEIYAGLFDDAVHVSEDRQECDVCVVLNTTWACSLLVPSIHDRPKGKHVFSLFRIGDTFQALQRLCHISTHI
jgi:hypothetical protein